MVSNDKMKTFLVVTVLICAIYVAASGATGGRNLNEKLEKLLEKLKKEMPCGFPDKEIPPLAPYSKDYAEWKHSNMLLSILASIMDFRVDGLNKFRTNEVKFSVATLKSTFDLSFQELRSQGHYVNNLVMIKILKLAGVGDVGCVLEDLRIKGKIQLAAKDKGLYIKKFEVVTVLGDFKSNITGILGGGLFQKWTNRIIERIALFFIKYQSNLLSEIIYDVVVPLANDILKEYTIRDLLDLVNSGDNPVQCIPPKHVESIMTT